MGLRAWLWRWLIGPDKGLVKEAARFGSKPSVGKHDMVKQSHYLKLSRKREAARRRLEAGPRRRRSDRDTTKLRAVK
jgi:hypothetical protein